MEVEGEGKGKERNERWGWREGRQRRVVLRNCRIEGWDGRCVMYEVVRNHEDSAIVQMFDTSLPQVLFASYWLRDPCY